MILIAHRGLINGPSKELENSPSSIDLAFSKGYHCEIDVWHTYGKWFLGHDEPTYRIDYEFLEQPNLWIHAKNLDALYVLGANRSLNFFWHQEDDYTLTSQGDIWAYPGKPLNKDCVQVMPEWKDPEFKNLNSNCLAICSDWVERIRELIPSAQT